MTDGSEQGAFGPMKALTATALLLALSAVALAKPNPVERSRLALVNADINMGSVGAMRENIGSVGAMRERDYFKAPHPPFEADAYPCRLEPTLFAKTRLAQSCR
ncbi:MAG: hypothetical protein ACM3Z4_10690 [Hyphomicrobiales bacterium]